MKRRFTILLSALALLTFLIAPNGVLGQTYEEVLNLNCAYASENGSTNLYGVNNTTTMGASGIKSFLRVAAHESTTQTDEIVNGDVTTSGSIYWAKGNGGTGIPNNVLKIGKASAGGSISFSILDSYDQIKRVSITGYGWKTTTAVAVNGSSTQSPSSAATEVTFTFDLSEATRTIAINVTNSAFCATNIVLYKESSGGTSTVSAPTISPESTWFATSQEVIITPAEGTTMYYTTNGSDPTNTGTGYTSAQTITITETTTVKAVSYDNNNNPSDVISATYTKPMTVAAAIAALTSSSPIEDAYVSGIISQVDSYNTTYQSITYWISDDGTTTTQLQVYSGKGLEGADFSALSDLKVGDEVVVNGTLKIYNTTHEFDHSSVLVYFNRPESDDPVVTIPTDPITLPSDGGSGNLDITYNNLTISSSENFGVLFYDDENATNQLTGSDIPTWVGQSFSGSSTEGYKFNYDVATYTGTDARIAYLKVYGIDDDLETEGLSDLLTITQNAPTNDVIDLRGTTTAISFNAGDFTSTGNGYQSYTNVTYQGNNNVNYSGWDLTNVMHYNNDMQMKANSGAVVMPTIKTDYGFTITVNEVTNSVTVSNGNETDGENTLTTSDTEAEITIKAGSSYAVISTITITPLEAPEQYTLTINAIENLTIAAYVGQDLTTPVLQGAGSTQVYSAQQVTLNISANDGYVIHSLVVDNEDVTSQIVENTYTFTMPEQSVIINATAIVPANYKLFSGTIVEGDYLIVYDEGAMNNTVVSNRLQFAAVTPENNVISTDNAAIVWHIAPSGDYWTIYSATANAYAASTGANNKAQMLADGTDDKALWTVSGTETYEFVNKQNTTNNANANLRKNGDYGFACYATTTGGALSLYKKVETTESYTLDVTTCTYSSDNNTGYTLIASPIGQVAPGDVTNMTSNDYDLYSYDGTQDGAEWQNFKANAFENLESGKGYLYANSGDGSNTSITLTFTGAANTTIEDVDLPYTKGNTIKSLYLAGNSTPNATTFYVYDGELAAQTTNFLTINEYGDGFITTSASSFEAAAKQGFFVQAGGSDWTLSTTNVNLKSVSQLNVKVTRNRGQVIDNAIVSFSNAPTMHKFMLSEKATKLYVPMNGKDYAVVNSSNQGRMPVNFKAAKNGNYTITVDVENVEASYLHLVDNLTGADIDLLANPSYSFDANTSDFEARFALVYNTNAEVNENTDDNFVYFNGSEWIINNGDNATVQVIDMLGRVVMSANNAQSISTDNIASGVYVIRLTNGSDVKTQKIVVE